MTTVIPQGFILFTPQLEHQQYDPILIGILLSFAFFGIGLCQFYSTYQQMRQLWALGDRDWFHITALIWLFIADLADSITKAAFLDIFTFRIITGGAGAVAIAPHIIFSLLITAAIIASMTHLIYCRRILRLQSRMRTNMTWVYISLSITMIVSIATLGCAANNGYIAMAFPSSEWIPKMIPTAVGQLGGSAVVDCFLCGAFIYSLRRNVSDFKSTNDVVSRWTMWTLETNLLTSILQIVELALFLTFKDRAYHEAVIIILPKIYINSILLLTNTVFSNRIKYKEEGGMANSSREKSRFGQVSGRNHTQNMTNGGFGNMSSNGAITGITVNIEKQFDVSDDMELPEVSKKDYANSYTV